MGLRDDPEVMRQYKREWIARRRHDFFKDKFCAWCGSTERLELDHIDPRTKVSHAIWSWAEHRRLAEIAKCQVLCHDCHAIKTVQERLYVVPEHGTLARYKHKALPCKCADCSAANAAYEKVRRTGVAPGEGSMDALVM